MFDRFSNQDKGEPDGDDGFRKHGDSMRMTAEVTEPPARKYDYKLHADGGFGSPLCYHSNAFDARVHLIARSFVARKMVLCF